MPIEAGCCTAAGFVVDRKAASLDVFFFSYSFKVIWIYAGSVRT
jgi:hypothetical protein